MSNGARHGWGIPAGVVLTAVLGGLLVFGTYKLHLYLDSPGGHTGPQQDKWVGVGLLAAAGLVLALLAASRLSPIGSLIAGLVFVAAGVLYFVSLRTTLDLDQKFPVARLRRTLDDLEGTGIFITVGAGLLIASFFPSRWRSAETAPEYADEIPMAEPDERPARHRHARDDTAVQPWPEATGPAQTAPYERPGGYEPPQQGYQRPPFDPPGQA